MSAAKRKRKAPSRPSLPGKAFALARGRGRVVTLVVLTAGLLFGAWYLVWSKVRDYVLASDDYMITAEKVEITPAPTWIHSDVRREVFRNASLDGTLSIMDDELAQRINDAFSLHPWVAEVRRVTRHHPARLQVDLVYRRPVCMVEAPGDLLPVDARGVLLPAGDFSPVEKSGYPRLIGIDTYPLGTAGESWGDARVVGGAEVAGALAAVWNEFQLSRIVPSLPGVSQEPTYTLLTRGGTKIYWGRAPGSDGPGELGTAEKIARLRKHLKDHGTLEGHDAARTLDVHQLQPARLSARPNR